jgi:carboxyl-terminal processing protease
MQFQGEQNGSTAMKKKPCIVVLVITFLLISCSQPAATPSTVPSTPTTVPTHTPQVVANEEYLSTFETVWQTVNDKYFDPTFGGLDWSEVHERYQPLIATAENDNEFYERLNVMLFDQQFPFWDCFTCPHCT